MKQLLLCAALLLIPRPRARAEEPPAQQPADPAPKAAAAPFPDPSTWSSEQLYDLHVRARAEKAKRAAARGDILAWGRAVMPEKFFKPFCHELHDYFVSIRLAELTSTVAPRGHAKTLVKCCLIPLYQALVEPTSFDYYLNVQATNKKGVAVNFAIKYELENNPVIKLLYGDQVGSVVWTNELFMLRNGVVFQGAGAGDSIRGMQWLNRRPKYTVVDDLYDEEDIGNPERIRSKNEWFWSSLYPARQKGKDTAFHAQGTVAGPQDIMAELGEMAKADKSIKHREFSAYDPKTGKVLWPEMNSLASLQQERERMGSVIFDREMQGERRNPALSIIKDNWLEGWEYNPLVRWGNWQKDFGPHSEVKIMGALMGVDPSTGKDEGDPAAFCVAIETRGPGSRVDYWVEDLFVDTLSFEKRLEKMETMKAQYEGRYPDPSFRIRRAYVESIGGFADFGNQAKARTGLPVEIIGWVKGKVANLAAKSGHFEFGRVHVSVNIRKKERDLLKEQLTVNEPAQDDARDSVLLVLEEPPAKNMRSWVIGEGPAPRPTA